MNGMLDVVLRSSVIISIALAATAALRSKSAALRHLVLAGGILASAAVVPLGLLVPHWDVTIPAPRSASTTVSNLNDVATLKPGVVAADESPRDGFPLEQAIAIAWAGGSLASALWLLASFRRLTRMTRDATPVTDARWLNSITDLGARFGVGQVAILETRTTDVLATWGAQRPRILLPRHSDEWSDARIHVVLCHELAHIARADWSVQIATELVRAAFWFNPLFWIACARLRRESEQACDDAVLGAGVAPAEYASHLVDIARACRQVSPPLNTAMPIARPSTLEWRITAMLNTSLSRTAPSRRMLVVALLVLLAVTIPAASFRAAAQDGPLPFFGAVYDTSGAVLPAVTLTLEDATGAKRTATTDGSGRFEFDAVPPGTYVISSEIPGFLKLHQDVTLKEPRHWLRAITLQIASLRETITVTDERPAGVTAPAIAQPVGALRVGGNIRAPHKVRDVRPIYPQEMRDGGFEGTVPMEAQIGVDGSVTSVRVISAQVHPDLAKAAVEAVKQWQFTPTLLNGVAVEVFMNVSVDFKLP